MKNNRLHEIVRTVVGGGYGDIAGLCRQAYESGISAREIVIHGLSAGMVETAGLYRKKGMYLDAIIRSAAAFQMGLAALQAPLEKERKAPIGKVVIGVPDGPWTIGKDIVSAILRAHDLEVIDAGADVAPQEIAKKAAETKADIVAVGLYLAYRARASAAELEAELLRLGIRHRIKVIVSGPSATKRLAAELGADGYAKDALELVKASMEFCRKGRTRRAPLQRILTTLKLQEADRVPFLPLSMAFSAKYAGVPYSSYITEAEALAEAEVRTARAFGWDAAIVSNDVAGCCGAFGAEVVLGRDGLSRIAAPAIRLEKAREDFEALRSKPVDHYLGRGRIPMMIDAVRRVKAEVGDEMAVVGWTQGPFQGAMTIFAADPRVFFLMDSDPDLLNEIIGWFGDFQVEYARAMIDAGADLIGAGESSGYFMSPETFKRFVHGHEKRTYERIGALGAPVIVHCCGYVPQCIGFAPEVNPGGALHFDHQVNLEKAKKQIGDRMTLMGNIDTNRVLQLGSPKDVERACAKAIEAAAPGGGFILSGGCEIPRDMPEENMRAMRRAVEEHGSYPLQKRAG
jgi:uroporphyrinogen decarboxylase